MNQQVHDVYEQMVIAVARLGREVSGVEHALCDAIHHVAHAIPWLDGDQGEPGAARFAAHEAYLSVIGIGQALVEAPAGKAVDAAVRSVHAVLDALAPHVSRADRALRRVLLEGEPLEVALERLDQGRGFRSAPGTPSG